MNIRCLNSLCRKIGPKVIQVNDEAGNKKTIFIKITELKI